MMSKPRFEIPARDLPWFNLYEGQGKDRVLLTATLGGVGDLVCAEDLAEATEEQVLVCLPDPADVVRYLTFQP